MVRSVFFAHFARCLMFATGCSESAQLSQVELHCNILQLHWGKQMTLFLLQWKNSVNALCSLCRKHGNTFLCESNDTNVTKSSASTTSTSTTSWKVGHGQLSHWVWPEEEWTSVKDCEESWFDVKKFEKESHDWDNLDAKIRCRFKIHLLGVTQMQQVCTLLATAA